MTITNAIITAYCACTNCCGPNAAGLAANGQPPVQGITIAGPRTYRLGTTVEIHNLVGFGNIGRHRFILNDRTAKRFDGRWDIYFASHKEALKFGKQTNNITVYGQR